MTDQGPTHDQFRQPAATAGADPCDRGEHRFAYVIAVANGMVTHVHSRRVCAGRSYGCWIHDPKPHALSEAPVVFREDTSERRCEHGIGHPDPQDAASWWHEHRRDVTIHGCDGCCGPLPEWAGEAGNR